MFGHKLPLVIIDFPNGRCGYRGSVPAELCKVREATESDVLGQRAWKGEDGGLYAADPMSFPTREEAIDYAAQHGHTVQ